MKKSNLRNFQAYRMYQAPEGGGEKPLRTSYLKDLFRGSPSRGGGGTPTHAQRQGQNVSGHNMSGQYMSARLEHGGGQDLLGRVALLQGAGSCPVVDTLDTSRQSPRHSRRMTKATGNTAASQFQVRRRFG